MPAVVLTSPLAAAALLLPAVAFALLGLMRDAPGEWGQGALIAWTALAAALMAGIGLQAGATVAPWIGLVLAFVAIMTGGPPGLIVVALAAVVFLLPAAGGAAPRWLALGLALLPLAVALRRTVGG